MKPHVPAVSIRVDGTYDGPYGQWRLVQFRQPIKVWESCPGLLEAALYPGGRECQMGSVAFRKSWLTGGMSVTLA